MTDSLQFRDLQITAIVAEQDSPLRHLVATEMAIPQPPQQLRDKAYDYVHAYSRDKLSTPDREITDKVLRLLVDADTEGLTNYLHQFAQQNEGIEKAMYSVVRAMTNVGIDASWNYSPKEKEIPLLGDNNYNPAAPHDVGHLNLTYVNSRTNGFTMVRFSTKGEPETASSSGAWDREDPPASTALRTIRDSWIRRTM